MKYISKSVKEWKREERKMKCAQIHREEWWKERKESQINKMKEE